MHEGAAHTSVRSPARPALELSDIVRAHGQAYRQRHVLTPEQHAVLSAIERCRTAALGGHLDVCAACGYSEPSYNSCRNRHCPKCQALAQARWIEGRMQRVLPTHYFHVVFTLPAELRPLAAHNRRRIFDLLFAAASATLLELGRDPERLGAELGITMVLHTWARDLQFHPHVHAIVTGGGLSLDGTRWVHAPPDFLFPVQVMGALFRGKFLAALDAAYARGELTLPEEGGPTDPEAWDRLRDRLYRLPWVVYAKRPFGGPEQVIRYLGRYPHRVGISNQRLVRMDDDGITFRTKEGKTVTLLPEPFLARFLQHVLPDGFVKIRHYGLMASSHATTKLELARERLAPVTAARLCRAAEPPGTGDDDRGSFVLVLLRLTGIDVRLCPACHQPTMVRQPLPGPPSRAPPVAA
jgi:hypothetical protein